MMSAPIALHLSSGIVIASPRPKLTTDDHPNQSSTYLHRRHGPSNSSGNNGSIASPPYASEQHPNPHSSCCCTAAPTPHQQPQFERERRSSCIPRRISRAGTMARAVASARSARGSGAAPTPEATCRRRRAAGQTGCRARAAPGGAAAMGGAEQATARGAAARGAAARGGAAARSASQRAPRVHPAIAQYGQLERQEGISAGMQGGGARRPRCRCGGGAGACHIHCSTRQTHLRGLGWLGQGA
ncbi:hypothetical protein CB0940_07960 [Cercospora beticola]|uniref:Uncharacterized protein n=1 Tax=Cercospora beticola TaxID=122368 RepID=A0A2G5H871_CERBT|nr:hypothetical protein CB0940_07960 [Cercospora beticola]PIA88721.1 hypothetical protein CB0940_07960 [Cercospora beticola]